MNSTFSAIYQRLYKNFRRRTYPLKRKPYFDQNNLIVLIKLTIDTHPKSDAIRIDAKYFLLVNFFHLIVQPLTKYNEQYHENFISLGDISTSIKHDINIILENSVSNSSEPEASGHYIMSTINKVWPQLILTNFKIWS